MVHKEIRRSGGNPVFVQALDGGAGENDIETALEQSGF
jgi:hypothetical protein